MSEKNIKRSIFKGKKKENYIKRDIFLKGKKKVVYSRGARRAGKGKRQESGNGGGKERAETFAACMPFQRAKKKDGGKSPRLLVCVVFDPVFVIVDKCFVFELPRGDKLVPNAFIILFSLQMAHERINAQF